MMVLMMKLVAFLKIFRLITKTMMKLEEMMMVMMMMTMTMTTMMMMMIFNCNDDDHEDDESGPCQGTSLMALRSWEM